MQPAAGLGAGLLVNSLFWKGFVRAWQRRVCVRMRGYCLIFYIMYFEMLGVRVGSQAMPLYIGLIFVIKIVDVREATEEERTHDHAH